MKNPYKFLLILSLSLVYLVIAAGSIVRMTGVVWDVLIGQNALDILYLLLKNPNSNGSLSIRTKKDRSYSR